MYAVNLADARELWPILLVVLKVGGVLVALLPFMIWPAARHMRRRAYGKGGGLR